MYTSRAAISADSLRHACRRGLAEIRVGKVQTFSFTLHPTDQTKIRFFLAWRGAGLAHSFPAAVIKLGLDPQLLLQSLAYLICSRQLFWCFK